MPTQQEKPMRDRVLLVSVVLVALACTDGAETTAPALTPGDDLLLQVATSSPPGRLPAAPARIEGARIEGHHLIITLSHGGGCRPHNFGLFTGPDFGSSNPPYALFRLAHESHGDQCEALLRRTLSVDLRPIEAVIRGMGASAVRFQLAEPGDVIAGVGELVYEFD
jgi:hypothetical protein